MSWYLFFTQWGWAAMYGDQKVIKKCCLPTPSPLNTLLYVYKQAGPSARLVYNDDFSMPIINRMRLYFSGQVISDWELQTDLSSLPDFSRRVLEYVYTIPYGETRTYGEVAAAISHPRAARAVGNALKHNPIPLIIPCHRVVASNGLGGFTADGGLKTKKELLLLETKSINK